MSRIGGGDTTISYQMNDGILSTAGSTIQEYYVENLTSFNMRVIQVAAFIELSEVDYTDAVAGSYQATLTFELVGP